MLGEYQKTYFSDKYNGDVLYYSKIKKLKVGAGPIWGKKIGDEQIETAKHPFIFTLLCSFILLLISSGIGQFLISIIGIDYDTGGYAATGIFFVSLFAILMFITPRLIEFKYVRKIIDEQK